MRFLTILSVAACAFGQQVFPPSGGGGTAAPLAWNVGVCSNGLAGWRGNLPSTNAPTPTGCANARPVLQFSSAQTVQNWWAEYPVPAGVSNAVYELTGHFRSADTTHSLEIPYAWECLAPGASYDNPAFNDGSGTWTVGTVASTGTQSTVSITTTCDAGQITALRFTPTLTSFTQALDWIDLYTPISGVAGPAGNTILYGTAAPTTEGQDGDFYIRTSTNYIYGPKASGAWPSGTSLVGPAGSVSVIASGTATLGTSEIAANACASVVTVSATGVATTDIIAATFNADVSATTGYGKGSADGLIVYTYPTADTINVKVCNGTGSAITPGAATLNVKVLR